MLKKHFWKLLALLVIILIGGSIIYAQKAAKEANEGVVIEAHVKGDPDATLTLVEYSDFECPACAQLYPYLKDIMTEHGDSLRFEYKHFPLIGVHNLAVPAAMAAEAAGQQGKFFEMHDKLFENQSAWSRSANPQANFVQYATELGLDVDLFKKHLGSTLLKDSITTSFNEARGLGLTGTPTLLLDGKKVTVNSFDELRSQVAEAISAKQQ